MGGKGGPRCQNGREDGGLSARIHCRKEARTAGGKRAGPCAATEAGWAPGHLTDTTTGAREGGHCSARWGGGPAQHSSGKSHRQGANTSGHYHGSFIAAWAATWRNTRGACCARGVPELRRADQTAKESLAAGSRRSLGGTDYQFPRRSRTAQLPALGSTAGRGITCPSGSTAGAAPARARARHPPP